MKIYLKGILALSLILGISCGNREKSEQPDYPVNISIKVSDQRKDSLNLSEIAYKIEYIPLQTKDSILLADIYNFNIVRDYLFIQNGQSVYRFDQNGQFKNSIFDVGKGPEETIPICFAANEQDSSVYVFGWNRFINVYSYSGEYLRTIKKPISPLEFCYFTIDFFNSSLFIHNPQLPYVKYIYSCYDFKNDSLIVLCNNSRKYDKFQMNPVFIPWDYHYQVQGSNLLYKENFSDTIYSVDTNFNQHARYIINLGSDKLEWETWRDNSMFVMPDAPIAGYGIQSFIETESYLLLNIDSFKDLDLLALYNRNDHSVRLYPCNGNKHPKTNQMLQVYLRNDLDGLIPIPLPNLKGYFDSFEGCLFIPINALDFEQAYSKAPESIKKSTDYLRKMYPVLSQINENSNAIIVKLYLK